MHTHRVKATLAVVGILRRTPWPSGVGWALIAKMRTLLIFNLCNNQKSPLSLLWQPFAEHFSMQHHAEHLGLINLAYFGLSHSPPQGFDCLHFMAWHTEDQAAVIPPKIPRKSNRLSQNLNSQLFDSKILCVEPVGVDFSFLSPEGIWKFLLSYIWKGKSYSLEKKIQALANRWRWEWGEPSPWPWHYTMWKLKPMWCSDWSCGPASNLLKLWWAWPQTTWALWEEQVLLPFCL